MGEVTNGETLPRLALSSFTTSVGFALGELLLLTERPEELLEHLRAINVSAQATLMASDLEAGRRPIQRPGISLPVAALGVVSAWHREPSDRALLGEAISVMEEVLEEMGVRYTPPDPG